MPVHHKYRLFFLILIVPCFAFSQSIERIEPPFWWTAMKNPQLQLLIYGQNIGNTNPEIESESVEIQATHQLSNRNYLFLDLLIDEEANEGSFTIHFLKDGERVLSHDYELKARRPGSALREGFNNTDVMYLITPDRFANGEPNNDEMEGLREGLNRTAEYGRHGGDIKGMSDHLSYIKDLGFTAIWLNPILENDQDQWSYHGYSTTDYYKVDPRFGTNEEYRALSIRAKEMGIKMIMDIIVNHCGSMHWWMDDPPSKDWINYYEKPYQQTNHRKSTLLDPYVAPDDRRKMVEGWFVRSMPDLNQRNPFMATYLIQNSIWWIEFAELAGIRQDTYSYPFRDFMTDWTCAIMDEYPNFNIVGEEWVSDQSMIAYWQRGKSNPDGYSACLPSLMDFPMCTNLRESLVEEENWGSGIIKLYENLTRDYHYAKPNDLVIFPDNHDMSRIFSVLDEDFDLYKMAIGYILTMRGIPQLYYGTEILMANPGTDSHGIIRSDFPGGWPGDQVDAFSGAGLSEQQKEATRFVQKVLLWRQKKEVIHYGKLMHYIPENGTYVYFRYNERESVMIVLNKNESSTKLKINRFADRFNGFTRGNSILSDFTFNTDAEEITLAPKSILICELH